MNISIIHPSRGRPEMAKATMVKWLQNCDKKGNVQYLLSLDNDDADNYLNVFGKYMEYYSNDNKSAIEAINYAVQSYSVGHKWDIVIVNSDDISCPPHWDTLLLQALDGKEDFCAKVFDGQQDWLITLPILDRKYYERFGYVYNPAYQHMHVDLEMTCVAWMLGRYVKIDGMEFHHNHPRYTNQVYDATYQKARATWGQGKQLFTKRLKENFGLTGDLIPLPQLPPH